MVRKVKKLATCGRTLEPTSLSSIWQDLEEMIDLQQAEIRETLLGKETRKKVLEAGNTVTFGSKGCER